MFSAHLGEKLYKRKNEREKKKATIDKDSLWRGAELA
jgi:hypothetical protein